MIIPFFFFQYVMRKAPKSGTDSEDERMRQKNNCIVSIVFNLNENSYTICFVCKMTKDGWGDITFNIQ